MNILRIRRNSTNAFLMTFTFIFSALLFLGFSQTVMAEDASISVEISALGYIEGVPFEVLLDSSVTYTYTVTNTGGETVRIYSVTDDECGPAIPTTNVVDGDILGLDETLSYMCTKIMNTQGPVTNTVTVVGDNFVRTEVVRATDTFNTIVRGTSCPLGYGYWKTHSPIPTSNFPTASRKSLHEKKIDPVWKTEGYDQLNWNGVKWYDMLYTSAKGGSAWHKLVHQYMTARLNISSGADQYEIVEVTTSAEEWLYDNVNYFLGTSYSSPNPEGAEPIDESWLGTLALFNKGELGTEDCSKR